MSQQVLERSTEFCYVNYMNSRPFSILLLLLLLLKCTVKQESPRETDHEEQMGATWKAGALPHSKLKREQEVACKGAYTPPDVVVRRTESWGRGGQQGSSRKDSL